LSPQMGEGPPLSLRCAARAAGPMPGPGPTAWAYGIGRAQASDRAGTGPYAPGRPPRLCEAVWSPVPPFQGRSDCLHIREAAEAALSGRTADDPPFGPRD
jgi:hypothetical protein